MSTQDGSAGQTDFAAAVIRVISSLDSGVVMTYGEVAAEAGFPGAARAVGSVLRSVEGLKWWRVVAANGRLVPGHVGEHTRRLEREGWVVEDGRIVGSTVDGLTSGQ